MDSLSNNTAAQNKQQVVAQADLKELKGFAKIVSAFVKSTPKEVAEAIYKQVIIPSAWNILGQAANTALQMFSGGMTFNGVMINNPINSNRPITRFSTAGQSNEQKGAEAPANGYTGLSVYNRLTWPTYEDANAVLQNMCDWLSETHFVSVAKLCQFSGVRSVHTDNDWGWDDLRNVVPVPVYGGSYALPLPAVKKRTQTTR